MQKCVSSCLQWMRLSLWYNHGTVQGNRLPACFCCERFAGVLSCTAALYLLNAQQQHSTLMHSSTLLILMHSSTLMLSDSSRLCLAQHRAQQPPQLGPPQHGGFHFNYPGPTRASSRPAAQLSVVPGDYAWAHAHAASAAERTATSCNSPIGRTARDSSTHAALPCRDMLAQT